MELTFSLNMKIIRIWHFLVGSLSSYCLNFFFKEKHYADNSISCDDGINNLIVMVCMESKLLGWVLFITH